MYSNSRKILNITHVCNVTIHRIRYANFKSTQPASTCPDDDNGGLSRITGRNVKISATRPDYNFNRNEYGSEMGGHIDKYIVLFCKNDRTLYRFAPVST